jgi:hypothetical protein
MVHGAYAAAAAAGHAATEYALPAAAAAGHAAKTAALDYALPAAGHVAKGLGSAAAAAASATSTHVIPAMKDAATHSFSLASRVLSAATLSASDIIHALSEFEREPGYSAHMALENGHHQALGNGGSSRSRTDTPKRRIRGKSPAAASASAAHEHSYASAQEWLEYSHQRGVLVEELWKRKNWQSFIAGANRKDDYRKKLLSLSSHDLAEILVKLDGH